MLIKYLKFSEYDRYVALIGQRCEYFEFQQFDLDAIVRVNVEALLMRLKHLLILLRHRNNVLEYNYLNLTVHVCV
jgi:hypothetical protein